jgi:hypothetical protein
MDANECSPAESLWMGGVISDGDDLHGIIAAMPRAVCIVDDDAGEGGVMEHYTVARIKVLLDREAVTKAFVG